MTFLPTDTPSIFATPAEISPAAEPRHAATGPSPPACYPSGNRSDALQLRHVHVAVDAVDAFSWALIEAVQRAGLDTAAGAVKARIIARRGNQTRNIAKGRRRPQAPHPDLLRPARRAAPRPVRAGRP